MADEDEIDIIGDFSFNSCFAQNSQGIPSCSEEDTVHPQWLLDSTANNWYDIDDKIAKRRKEGFPRKLSGNNSRNTHNCEELITWSVAERDILKKEMAKYGRDVYKISQTLKSKSRAEIQALIEAEYGVILDIPVFGLGKPEEIDNVPSVVQEEIVADDTNCLVNIVTTASPTIPVIKKKFRNQQNVKNAIKVLSNLDSLAEPNKILLQNNSDKPEQLMESSVIVSRDKKQKGKVKTSKKLGNHRRKVSKVIEKGHIKRNDLLASPQGRQRTSSTLSEDSTKSPKMHILLGSGLALSVSEGEEVIKLEKKKDSECESDIEVDIDSDKEESAPRDCYRERNVSEKNAETHQVPAATRKFEPMPKRNRKINLDGGGGCTIMHTAAGDLYEVSSEPRRERPQKKPVIQLYPCRVYNNDKPAPYSVRLQVSVLIAMDAHAHTSRAEVMGLVGGSWAPPLLTLQRYGRVRAAAQRTHCDMDPVSQAQAAEALRAAGACVVGWHHSHPAFPAAPSALDLRTQRALQALPAAAPALAVITSQHWPVGRTASHYRCLRVEETDPQTDVPAGYQLSVRLVNDLTASRLPTFLAELAVALQPDPDDALRVDPAVDVCPQANLTYLEKLISSVSQHMRSAGCEPGEPLLGQLAAGIRDLFR